MQRLSELEGPSGRVSPAVLLHMFADAALKHKGHGGLRGFAQGIIGQMLPERLV